MRKKHQKRAARCWAALFLLALGCFLPPMVSHDIERLPREVQLLLEETTAEETDLERIAFVRAACSLVGRVKYFWGGKSRELGWDARWGWPRRVSAPGSESTGHIRSYGLDCSGLVSWAAATGMREAAVYDRIGEGVRAQYAACMPVSQPRTGDLAFFSDLSHVGIILGQDNMGRLWVVHSSATLGGVVVSENGDGFTLYGTPAIFRREACT